MFAKKIHNVCVTLLRFLLAAWVGAAVLYVITSVAEQISPDFDSRIRDQLATIRFPIYYKFGAFIYGATAVLAVAVWRLQPESHRHIITLGLIAVSGAIYAWDYFQTGQNAGVCSAAYAFPKRECHSSEHDADCWTDLLRASLNHP